MIAESPVELNKLALASWPSYLLCKASTTTLLSFQSVALFYYQEGQHLTLTAVEILARICESLTHISVDKFNNNASF